MRSTSTQEAYLWAVTNQLEVSHPAIHEEIEEMMKVQTEKLPLYEIYITRICDCTRT